MARHLPSRHSGAGLLLKRSRILLLAGFASVFTTAWGVPQRAAACEGDCAADSGFSISFDGQNVAGEAGMAVDGRAVPDIQVKYDGLEVKPILNVSTVELRRAYRPGEAVDFLASLNYPAWVSRKEVLIFETGQGASARPIAVLPVDGEGNAAWTMPEEGEGEFAYVLRVSDRENRFDETVPLTLSRSSGELPRHAKEKPVAAGLGEDRTAVRNIPVHGGAVSVYGSGVPAGETVSALGEGVPVDGSGSFVVQRILPPGAHSVDVAVSGPGGVAFSRPIDIPENEWFYVALADLTVGKRWGKGDIEAAKGEGYGDVYTKGRLAFYLKGKIKGKTLLTAAVNTGEGKVEDLFKDFASKDPRGVLRRIDPETYYPVYGDDSTSVEGAPTDGKFYVRLDRGDSHAMWGRFKARINDSKLLRNERTLYGAEGEYRSEAATTFGERKVEARAYAAQPGTIQGRDVLRGTGGSAYFLKHQDVLRDTETLSVVVTDKGGRVISRRQLVPGEDYEINYFQGVVILKKPLQSTATDGRVVRDEALGENRVSLVVNYEYTPAAGDVDDTAFGGEANAWVGEHLRVGATGMSERTGRGEQTMGGLNAQLRATEGTFAEAEVATAKGPGLRRSLSTDGGLTSTGTWHAGARDGKGGAWSLRGEADLADLDPALKGRLNAWYEEKEAGFSSLDYDVGTDQRSAGLRGSIDITEATTLRATAEDYEDSAERTERRASVEAEHRFGKQWKAAAGLTHSDLERPEADPGKSGRRLDAGVKATYTPNDDTELYGFGQATVWRRDGIDRNDRVGVGAKRKLTEKIGVEGEVSTGTSGIGALAAVTYDPTADDHYYAGYRLDPDAIRTSALDGLDGGGVVVGARRRYSDLLSGYAENHYDMFGRRRSLTSTYGVVYTPDKFWTVDGGFEGGEIDDPNASDFDRTAVSLGTAYKDEDKVSASVKGEVRVEESEDGARDRNSYLLAGAVSYKASEDWRVLASTNMVLSESDQTALLDGDFVEGDLGFAYRPVAHDRLNALAKYRFVYDLPGPDQVTADGTVLGPAQRSHVVSADVNYDLTQRVAIGGKYGLRFGEVSLTRDPDDFESSVAQLAVLRADITMVDDWDALVEGRLLATLEDQSVRQGVLAALYHDIGDTMKVGAGYNFANFSDDLTDLTYDDQGAFVNAVGKF